MKKLISKYIVLIVVSVTSFFSGVLITGITIEENQNNPMIEDSYSDWKYFSNIDNLYGDDIKLTVLAFKRVINGHQITVSKFCEKVSIKALWGILETGWYSVECGDYDVFTIDTNGVIVSKSTTELDVYFDKLNK